MFIDELDPEGDIPPSLVGVLVPIVKGDNVGTGSLDVTTITSSSEKCTLVSV